MAEGQPVKQFVHS
jgi:RNAse (barnase) inhibitor barstar